MSNKVFDKQLSNIFRNVSIDSDANSQNSVCETVEDEEEELQNFEQIFRSGQLEGFSNQANSQEQFLTFLGIRFKTANLLERNKDPVLLLRAVYLTILVQFSLGFFTFLYGSNFNLIFSIVYPINASVSLVFVTYSLKVSVSQFIQAPTRIQILYRIIPITNVTLVLYGFLKATPFDNQYIFIILLFFIIFCAAFLISLCGVRTDLSQNDEHYQLQYFGNRLMLAFINATGLTDVLSDIVLGFQAIIQFSQVQKGIGIALILLCIVDVVIILVRVLSPQKITLRIQVQTVALELAILGLSVWITFLTSNLQGSQSELLGIALISIGSTLINLFHHIFLIITWMTSLKNLQSSENLKVQMRRGNRGDLKTQQSSSNITVMFS